jgi:hypothetical protein
LARYIRILALCAAFVVSLQMLPAQTSTTGAVTGVVTDPSGAVVSGVDVILINPATGEKQKTTTNASGVYRLDLLPPGNYSLTIDQPGFARLDAHVTISNAQVLGENLKLAMGSNTQVVTVQATEAQLQSENGDVSNNVTQTQIEEVPNSGNNMTYVTRITPGMGTSGGFGVEGSTTLYTVDGMMNNDPYNNAGNSGASNLMLGDSEVQEATVTGNGYSGQYGGLAGAQVSFVTKSGTNRIHGAANYYWTGRSLVANNWFNNLHGSPRPFENANQWSADIGGPAIKDRLFWYLDTEGLRAILPSASTLVLVPSPNLQAVTLANLAKNGLSASVPYYNNMFSLYNQAAKAHNTQPGNGNGNLTGCPSTLTAGELSTLGGSPGACTDYFEGSATNYANEWLLTTRVDFSIGANDHGFARSETDEGAQPTYTDQINPIFNDISIQPQHSGQVNETHTFGSRAVNNIVLSGLWYGAMFGPSNVTATTGVFPAQLSLNDSTLYTLGGEDATFPEGRNVTTLQLQDDALVNAGNHTIKFGGRVYIVKENDHYFTSGTIPSEVASTLGAFINGGSDPNVASETTQFTQSFVPKPNHPIMLSQLAFYGEDDWKASRTLTLTAALRLDHQGNVRCLDHCLTLPLNPFPEMTHDATIPYDKALAFSQENVLPGLQALEWQPRVGYAYNPNILHQSLVIRGGAGIFFDGLPGNIVETIVKNPPTKNTFTVSGDNLASTQTSSNLYTDAVAYNQAYTAGIANGGTVASIKASLPASQQSHFSPPALYGPENNFKIYQIVKWNLEVQKSFGTGTTLSVNYLANYGFNKPFTNAGLNAYSTSIAGLPTSAPDTRFGKVYYIEAGGRSNYNGLITTFTQRFKNGDMFTAGYTYSKSLDTLTTAISSTTTGTTDIASAVDPYHPDARYGPASADLRNFLQLDYVYNLPFHNHFYGGWQVAGAAFLYSGLPFTVIDTAATNSISGSSATGGNYGGSLIPNYNYSGEASCSRPNQACLLASQFPKVGTTAYSTGSVDSSGPRNGFRGPDYIDTDISLMKTIPLHFENGRFSFGAQAYNVLNHPNFSRPSATLNSSTFGKITSTLNPSGIFSGVGGDDSPRILQIKGTLRF